VCTTAEGGIPCPRGLQDRDDGGGESLSGRDTSVTDAQASERGGGEGCGEPHRGELLDSLFDAIHRRTERHRLRTLAAGMLISGCSAGVAIGVFHYSGGAVVAGMGISLAQVIWFATARRYRAEVRRDIAPLPRDEQVSLLTALAGDRETRFLARPLLKELGSATTHVIPASPPDGRGDEVVAGETAPAPTPAGRGDEPTPAE